MGALRFVMDTIWGLEVSCRFFLRIRGDPATIGLYPTNHGSITCRCGGYGVTGVFPYA